MKTSPKSRADVDLADLLRAQVALRAETAEARAAIAELLGFAGSAARTASPVSPSSPPRAVVPRPKLPPPRAASRPVGAQPQHVEASSGTLPERSEETGLASSAWAQVEALPSAGVPARQVTLEHLPLIPAHWFRGLMTSLLAREEPSGMLDLESIERTALRGEPLLEIPWQLRRSLRRGVELWVDISESMDPYTRDQAALLRGLRGLVGERAVRLRCFELDPLLSPSQQLRWQEGDEPVEIASGAPVLVVSDLGVSRASAQGHRASAPAFVAWVARARERGGRVLGLIPAAQSAWPEGLDTLLLGFEWDRTLSVRRVASALASAAGRRSS